MNDSNQEPLLVSQLLSLEPGKATWTRREFVVSSLATGFALAVQPVSAQTITTDTKGLVAGDIGAGLEIPASTLSHHLEKLRNEDLVNARRQGTFLRYTANTEGLRELLTFLFAECCGRNRPLEPDEIVNRKGDKHGR